MDGVGTVLFLGCVCTLLLALQWGGQTYAWSDSRVIGLFVGFGAMAICFAGWQWRRGDQAIIPPRVLSKRSICMGAGVLFFLGMSSLTVRALPSSHDKRSEEWFDTKMAFALCLVRLLPPDILPVGPRCVHYAKWCPVYRPCPSPDCRLSLHWRCRLSMGLLRTHHSP